MENWAYLAYELTQKFPSITDIQVKYSGAANDSLKYSIKIFCIHFSSVEEYIC